MHALKVATGEQIWNWPVSKRGLNTAALMIGPDVIVSHSEENIGSSEMGMLAAVPTNKTGTLTDKDARWLMRGVQAGYASPVTDGQRIYIVDNGGVLFAFDAKTGKRLWEQNLGTIQKSSPVLADGKLYVGTENGKFYIIRPLAERPKSSIRIGSAANRTPSRSSRRRQSRAAASTSSRWTRSMPSVRRWRPRARRRIQRRPRSPPQRQTCRQACPPRCS